MRLRRTEHVTEQVVRHLPYQSLNRFHSHSSARQAVGKPSVFSISARRLGKTTERQRRPEENEKQIYPWWPIWRLAVCPETHWKTRKIGGKTFSKPSFRFTYFWVC